MKFAEFCKTYIIYIKIKQELENGSEVLFSKSDATLKWDRRQYEGLAIRRETIIIDIKGSLYAAREALDDKLWFKCAKYFASDEERSKKGLYAVLPFSIGF